MDTRLARQLPVRGWLRLLLRLPIWFYRLRLGWLLGERGLMLTHIGRRSGQPRQTVLEIIAHDPAADTYIVAAGWGERSDWFRNIQKTPHVLVDVGDRRFEAIAAPLSMVAYHVPPVQPRDYDLIVLVDQATGQLVGKVQIHPLDL